MEDQNYLDYKTEKVDKFYKPTREIYGSLILPMTNEEGYRDTYNPLNYTNILPDDTIFVIEYEAQYFRCIAINQMKIFYIHRDNFSFLLNRCEE